MAEKLVEFADKTEFTEETDKLVIMEALIIHLEDQGMMPPIRKGISDAMIKKIKSRCRWV